MNAADSLCAFEIAEHRRRILNKPLNHWNHIDLGYWLTSIGFGFCADEICQKLNYTGSVLLTITEEDIMNAGLPISEDLALVLYMEILLLQIYDCEGKCQRCFHLLKSPTQTTFLNYWSVGFCSSLPMSFSSF
ncbi:hypothetical protein T4E_10310 [Trichinella pseudospiralis]|uniref:SAM domain-containing protein n=2 Tax=Trichinella pseudospiralis TaxID=6337 RepID=A0A0V0XRT4_TRIPS|nr:hypothetical protein T4E_12327 [Trichinella pseudospiralis]KRX90610.1 hypothetical protein T4E_10310 [Trichinella pseudospiralis]